jgi:type II secretory pathway component GspD/PulD (secretin)
MVLMVAVCGTALAQRLTILNFREAPLSQVAEFYQDFTGTPVTIEPAAYPTITLATSNRLDEVQTIALIETYCASNGIVFTHSPTGVVISLDPARPVVMRPSYVIRRGNAAATNQPDAAMQKILEEYQLEVIRRGLPPLPEPDYIGTNAP